MMALVHIVWLCPRFANCFWNIYKFYLCILQVVFGHCSWFFCPFHTSMWIVHMVFVTCICCICTVSVLHLWSMRVPCNCKRCILSCASPNALPQIHDLLFAMRAVQRFMLHEIQYLSSWFLLGLTLSVCVMYNFCRISASTVGRGTWLRSVLQKISPRRISSVSSPFHLYLFSNICLPSAKI